MRYFVARPHRRLASVAWTLLVAASVVHADSLSVMPPLGIGPFKVGCTNVAQDFSRVPAGEDVQKYWEGIPDGGIGRYVTSLLAEPANTLQLNIAVPDDRTLFGDYATRHVPYVVLVCYPTAADNSRPDYPLPTGRTVPHMQRGNQVPLWAQPPVRYPVLAFGHGLGGSPLSNDYISAQAIFASYGYVVVAPFEGDARFADIRLEDFKDLAYALLNFKSFVAMQALRPLSMKLALDQVLAHPDFADHVDAAHVGAFGASLGAESAMLLTGARLSTTIGQSSQAVLKDPRISAVVGYVPYFGQPFYPAFGRDQNGLSGITVPFLGIAGTADTTAPIEVTEEGVRRLSGSRILVALEGVEHGFDVASTADIFTWSLVFLQAHVQNDPLARARLTRMQKVAGGGDDFTLIDYTAPSAPTAAERLVTEYYRSSKDHYFMTAEPAEAALLDAGVVVRGWTSTGFAFKAWPAGSPNGLATCRFFGTPGIGPDSHFYTSDPAECAKVRASAAWTYEGIAFNALPPNNGDCPADRVLVIRLYNNGRGGEANHRYTTSRSEIAEVLARGWLLEGPVFCGVP